MNEAIKKEAEKALDQIFIDSAYYPPSLDLRDRLLTFALQKQDEFAIGFSEWCHNAYEYMGNGVWQVYNSTIEYTSQELLIKYIEYKKEIQNK